MTPGPPSSILDQRSPNTLQRGVHCPESVSRRTMVGVEGKNKRNLKCHRENRAGKQRGRGSGEGTAFLESPEKPAGFPLTFCFSHINAFHTLTQTSPSGSGARNTDHSPRGSRALPLTRVTLRQGWTPHSLRGGQFFKPSLFHPGLHSHPLPSSPDAAPPSPLITSYFSSTG